LTIVNLTVFCFENTFFFPHLIVSTSLNKNKNKIDEELINYFHKIQGLKDQSKPPPQQQYQRGCQENSQEVNTTNHHHKTPTPPQNTQSISTTKPHLVFLSFLSSDSFLLYFKGSFLGNR